MTQIIDTCKRHGHTYNADLNKYLMKKINAKCVCVRTGNAVGAV